ncbi:MAG: FAD:protein FMN transferase [Candidatus Omnitrophica bacterium]|nr:FAD:protein FMN transferase [Candidatus Omnitrophota bacterium]
MYSDKLKRYLITALALGCGITFVYLALRTKTASYPSAPGIILEKPNRPIDAALDLLRVRKDKAALAILDKVLLSEPKNPQAIWGKAEVFRRAGQDRLAELMFREVLDIKPDYSPAWTSLAYLKYKEGNLRAAFNFTQQAFILSADNPDARALTYMLLGLIGSARPFNGGFVSRINRGMELKSYFLKAVRLGPELPDTHLALGIFYLAAPVLEGGNFKKGIRELEYALKIAPEFAAARALLTQAYKLRHTLYRNKRLMMGTFVEVISPDLKASGIVFNEFKRIESLLSRYDPKSEISRLNESGSLKVSPETFYIIQKSKEFWSATNGAFDITTGVLTDLWGFKDRRYCLPKEEEIKKALKLIGSDKIILQDIKSVVQFKLSGMKLDLGAIAKGYALDCAASKLKEAGIKSCLINAGGQVYCLGDKFSQPWRVAIKEARGKASNSYLELKDRCVATSGDYERCFFKNKKRYAHIFNPQTGYPAESGVISVSVIAADALSADALATAIFVLGKEKGEALARKFNNVHVSIIEDTRVQNN